MSDFTTKLRYILDDVNFDIGMEDYPIFDENYRHILNAKIFNHYYDYEIGFQTASMFRFYLNNTMNEIMPYYNKLYLSENLISEPLLSFKRNSHTLSENISDTDVNATNTSEKDETQTNDGNITDTNTLDTMTAFYDTPMGSLGDITSSSQVTSVDKNSGTNTTVTDNDSTLLIDSNITNTTDSNTHDTTNNDSTTDESGFNNSESELLMKYRETFINIDMMVIDSLSELFMGVYEYEANLYSF